ncbi:MAG TPA: hypothetical protein VEZ90_02925 [Blastocatellia bacterium]|nr:hypothetical protein [Blastocatellia bacterium]
MSAIPATSTSNALTLNQTRLAHDIDRIDELRGSGLVYIDDFSSRLLRPSQHSSGLETLVIIEDRRVATSPSQTSAPPVADHHGHSITSELVGMGLSCGSAVLSGTALLGEGAGTPFTEGLSAIPIPLTWAAFTASTLQCVNSVGRVISLSVNPTSLDQLDSSTWYKTTSEVLDVISLADAPVALGEAGKAIMLLRRSTGRPFFDLLKGMSRMERKRLAQELAFATGDARSGKQFKALVRDGKLPSIFSQTSIDRGIRIRLMDAVGSGLDITSSSRDGAINDTREWLGSQQPIGQPSFQSGGQFQGSRMIKIYIQQER